MGKTARSGEALSASARQFTELPPEAARELARHAQRIVLRKGALLHRKGDAADGLYRLVKGSVRLSTASADGRELLLTDPKAGAFFGEISLFDGLPRTHDAQSDLASMVGATRQSINKELQALQRDGLIQLIGRKMTLLDLEALRRRAGL